MTKTKASFVEGPLFGRMLAFTIPIMITGVLQICYNMADHMIVGKFSGDATALASVGSTSSLTSLITCFLMGLASGASVVVAQVFGAGNQNGVCRTVHTAISLSIIGGVFIGILGLVISEPALVLMDTHENIIEGAILYFRIICCGIPAMSLYNFSASIIRSIGDSKTPLIILSLSGILNVVLNLVFVLCFSMSIEGVALATIISQYASAITVLLLMIKRKNEPYAFSFKKIGIDKRVFLRIMRYGVPAGIQSSIFGISNVIISSAANVFPTTTITAKTIASNIDGITYTVCNSFSQSALTFAGQNYGAMKYDRLKKTLIYGVIQVTLAGILVSQLELLFADKLCLLFVDKNDPNLQIIINKTVEILKLMLSVYFLCGILEVLSGVLRGIGTSVSPMVCCIIGTAVMRIIWVFIIFPLPQFNTIIGLFLSYPVTWIITMILHSVNLIIRFKSIKKLNGKYNVDV